MPALSLPDVTLHYEIAGSGPPLVLIAGMCSDSASWAPVLPLLDGFTVIRPDNRSTGRTVPWDAPVGMAEYAGDILALLGHLGLGRAHLLGHSMGGMIALHLAQTAPAALASATLLAAAPVRLARNVALFRALVEIRESDAAPDLWLRAFFPWLFAPQVFEQPGAVEAALAGSLAYPHAQSAAAMRHQLGALSQYVPSSDAPGVPVQALLGADDLILPVDIAAAALARVPGTGVINIPGAGHSVHWDAPDAVADHLRGFINTTVRG